MTVFCLIAIVVMKWLWIFKSLVLYRPLIKSHTRRLLSSLTESKNLPFGWKHKSVTQLSWPIKIKIHLPDLVSHSLIVLSRLPLAKKSRTKWGAITVASALDSSYSPFLRVVAAALLLLRSSFIYYMRSAVVSCLFCDIAVCGLSSSSSPSSPSIIPAFDSSEPF